MTRKDNELVTVHYTANFTDKFVIDDNLNLLLNSISLYETIGNCVASNSKVDFEIKVINGKKVIYPLNVDYDSYVLFCDRLVKATVIEINASDYIHMKENNGKYSFIMQE